MAFDACVFIVNLNMDCYKFNILTFQGSATWTNEGFIFFNSQ
jgi:hypothetical protein